MIANGRGCKSPFGRAFAWHSRHEPGCGTPASERAAWNEALVCQLAAEDAVGGTWQVAQSSVTSGTPPSTESASCRIGPASGAREGAPARSVPTKPTGE